MYVSTLQPLIRVSPQEKQMESERALHVLFMDCGRQAQRAVMECMFSAVSCNNHMIYQYCHSPQNEILWSQRGTLLFLRAVKSNEILAEVLAGIYLEEGYESYTVEHVRNLQGELEKSVVLEEGMAKPEIESILVKAKAAMQEECLRTRTLLKELEQEYRYPGEDPDTMKISVTALADSIKTTAILGIIMADHAGASMQMAEIHAKKDLQKLLEFTSRS